MKPTIIAHRGNNFEYPENTLIGLRSAFELGCTAVEFDIQMAADNSLIIIHDEDTLRTSGIAGSVFDQDYQQLAEISIHEPERLAEQHKPQSISLLQDFLQLLEEFPTAHAYIEVKEQSLKKWGHQQVIDELIPLLANFTKQCTVISFDLPVLEMIREQSNLAIGWVLYHYDIASKESAERSKPDFLIIDQADLSLSAKPWQGPWEWMVYGVDSQELAFKHFDNGVNYVETDNLPAMLELQR